jgi:hypothetical protein
VEIGQILSTNPRPMIGCTSIAAPVISLGRPPAWATSGGDGTILCWNRSHRRERRISKELDRDTRRRGVRGIETRCSQQYVGTSEQFRVACAASGNRRPAPCLNGSAFWPEVNWTGMLDCQIAFNCGVAFQSTSGLSGPSPWNLMTRPSRQQQPVQHPNRAVANDRASSSACSGDGGSWACSGWSLRSLSIT